MAKVQSSPAPQWQRFTPNEFVELSTFHQLHAEVATIVAFADLVDRRDLRMLEAGRGFGFATEAFQMRLRRPMTERDHFQRDRAI